MGYEIAKSVVYKSRNEIIITSASNNIRPFIFEKFTYTNGIIAFIRNLSMKTIQIRDSANEYLWYYVLSEYKRKLAKLDIDFNKLHYLDKDSKKWNIYVRLFESCIEKGKELNKDRFIVGRFDYYVLSNLSKHRFYSTYDKSKAKRFKGLQAYYYANKYDLDIVKVNDNL